MTKYFLDESGCHVKTDLDTVVLSQSIDIIWEQELNIEKIRINAEDIIIQIMPTAKNRDITVKKLIFEKPAVIYNESKRIFKIDEIEFYKPDLGIIKVDVANHFNIYCILYEIIFDEPRITIGSNDEYGNHQKGVVTLAQESIIDSNFQEQFGYK